MDTVINSFVEKSKKILQDNLVGVYLHGSAVMGCYNPAKSDINLIVVVKESIEDSVKSTFMETNNDEIVLECGTECQGKIGCNFLCKWFASKNNYLFMELNALRNYLNSVPDNYFDTRIEVLVKTSDKSILDAEQFSYLAEYVDAR